MLAPGTSATTSDPWPDAESVSNFWDEVRVQLAKSFPKVGRVHRVPQGAPAEDLVDQPARASQQGDQAAARAWSGSSPTPPR